MKRVQPGSAPSEKRGWNDLPEATRRSLLAQMPDHVRARVRSGIPISEHEVATWMSQYYDLNRKVILWKVKGHERIAMRTVVKDAFESARASLVKHVGPEARKWTDLQIITINMAAPAGYHWEVTYEGGARE